MKMQIKRLYEDAANLYGQAKTILDEFKGKEMPKEKSAEVDALLDQVEAKTGEAKRLERAMESDALLNDPATRKNLFSQGGGDGAPQGGAGAPSEDAKAYASAHANYLRKGYAGLSAQEQKTLLAGEATAGGYLVGETNLKLLITKQRERSAMRRISNVLPPIAGGSAVTPTEDTMFSNAEWTTEIETGSTDTEKPFGGRVLTPHPLAKRVKVSNTLLRASSFDVETWVRDRMAYKFAVPEEAAFVNGDGVRKPLGIKQTAGLPTYTTTTANAIHGDDIINWVYTLPASYATQARILCNRAFIRKTRTLASKNASTTFTNYIWQPGLAAGQPNTILDVPYELSDQYDDALDSSDAWESNALAAVIGDFSYYWIVDSLSLSIQRLVELYAESNQIGFIGRKETDGMCVLPEAFLALKVKSS